nr:MAG TPA: head closure knob [Caudoviricetes sp.]
MTEAEILEMTYFDICTIKRKVKVKDEDAGVTTTELKVIAENIKCAISRKDTPIITSDGVGKIVYSNQLFTNPNIDIKESDILEVVSMGKTITYLASKPFPYPSHTITPITEKERV